MLAKPGLWLSYSHCGGVHWPGHQLLLWNKLDLAREQLFLEGKWRGALLLLITQRLSAGIILCWLCSGSNGRVGGCECCRGCCSDAQALPQRAGASLLRLGAGKEKYPRHNACAGGRRRESQGRRMLLVTTGTRL